MCVCLYNLLFVFVCVASQELNGILCYHNVKSAEVCVCVCVPDDVGVAAGWVWLLKQHHSVRHETLWNFVGVLL